MGFFNDYYIDLLGFSAGFFSQKVEFLMKSLGLGTTSAHLEQQAAPHGYRMLNKIPRIPPAIIENLVDRFKVLSRILRATIEELDEVEGIGEVRARSIKNGLMRMREQFLLEYMV